MPDEDDWDAPGADDGEALGSSLLAIGVRLTDGSLVGEYVYRSVKRCARAGALISTTSALERRPDLAGAVFLEAADQLKRAAARLEEAARAARIADRQNKPLHGLKVPGLEPDLPGKKTTVQ